MATNGAGTCLAYDCGSRPEHGVPRPLHIIKQAEKSELQEWISERRRSSCESIATHVSLDSGPGHPGDDEPLTVPKRRANRGSHALGGFGRANALQEQEQDRAGAESHVKAAADGPVKFTPHASPSPTQTHPGGLLLPPSRTNLAFPGLYRQGFDGAGDYDRDGRGLSPRPCSAKPSRPATPGRVRHDFSRLRNAKSMFHIQAAMPSPTDLLDGGGDVPAAIISPLTPRREPDSETDASGGAAPPDPFVLVPRIVVTPESKALDDGVTGLWAAVQLSTQVCPANAPDPMRQKTDYGWGLGRSLGLCPSASDVFQYGCLHDVSVQVLPTSNTAVIEVLDDSACAKNTLYPGSRLLVVAHVRLLSTSLSSYNTRGHARQSSDDLIKDLEYQLGSTTVEYLQVRVTYRHSGFPQQHGPPSLYNTAVDRVVGVQTTMETTAVAVIKRHNSSSPWSPRSAPQPNPLFEIIASH
ncbi:hypothetical protein B0T24DRAFT_176105 [Lasiosphaeria ovina]|uniref:Uncharacterized protein n=1 Tax=Lasiosphaeria ovina TaxID=92902 RepID=A0AAE0NEB8_9PEZI|nr:hypothetical protein B0T24DRAFT_176105 [Lasiosphaeria ovina]